MDVEQGNQLDCVAFAEFVARVCDKSLLYLTPCKRTYKSAGTLFLDSSAALGSVQCFKGEDREFSALPASIWERQTVPALQHSGLSFPCQVPGQCVNFRCLLSSLKGCQWLFGATGELHPNAGVQGRKFWKAIGGNVSRPQHVLRLTSYG